MRASTELFLWEMLSLAESLFRPSIYHAGESFEGWAYRNGLLRQIRRLEAEAYLERLPGGTADRVYRLTPKGRLAALGGRDPDECWSRSWDGRWRLLLFDLPAKPRTPRTQLLRFLQEEGFGCLQGSAWISPDPVDRIRKRLRGMRHASSLTLIEGETVGGEKAGDLVKSAWDFAAIKNEWLHFQNVLEQGKKWLKPGYGSNEEIREWAGKENAAWTEVLEIDPLLPAKLLPRGYPGPKIWIGRRRLWEKLRKRLVTENFSSQGKPES